MTRMIQCTKLNKQAEGLDFFPLPGELGRRLYENVSKEAWRDWLKKQTILINEYRLDMSDSNARQYLIEETGKYFFGDITETIHPNI